MNGGKRREAQRAATQFCVNNGMQWTALRAAADAGRLAGARRMMKRVNVENYQCDKYYPRVVRATTLILSRQDFVSPIDLLVEMGLLDIAAVSQWRAGRLPYLERVIQCNLSAASRILRIFRLHAHDLNLRPSATVYLRRAGGGRVGLRFTKTGETRIEQAYARHFLKMPAKREKPSSPQRQAAGCAA